MTGSSHLTRSVATRPRVAAIVLNYKAVEDTKNCVLSLQRSGYPNLEIVLVDNASQDGSVDELTRAFPHLPLLVQAKNLGYAGGNNAGIRYALQRETDYVLIANDDVVVQGDFLGPLVSLMERDHGVGVVAPKVLRATPPHEVFAAVGEFSRWRCTSLDRGRNKDLYNSDTVECEVDYVPGVLLLVRREVFETLGLLDERFFMYFEDVEFSRRVNTRYRMMYTARSVALHKGGAGRGWRNYSVLYLYYHTRNRIWLFRDEGALYRFYVVIFTLLNAIAKGVAISLNCFVHPRQMLEQWGALSRGFLDGLAGQKEGY